MQKNRWFLLALLLVALPAAAATPDITAMNAEIAQRLLTVMGGCEERIWPEYSWKNLNVVLIGASRHQAFSAKEKRLFELTSDQLPPAALNTDYFFFTRDGSEWMSINTALDFRNRPNRPFEEVVKDNFRLAIHEGFHRIAQRKWRIYEGNRGTELPIRWQPRFYRSMVFSHLKAALAQENQTELQLGKARYWYDKWAKEFPEEQASTADGYEGSARYADWIGYALSQYGCRTAETQVSEFIKSVLDTNYGFSVSGDLFAFDVEGYELGSLAAFLLRRDYREDWQRRLSKGESPLAILLEKFTPMPSEPDAAWQNKFISAREKFQDEADKLVGPATDALSGSGAIFVNLPRSWYLGSFSPLGFYIDRASGMQFMPMAMPLNFQAGRSLMKSNASAVFLSTIPSPCGMPSDWHFVVSAANAHPDAGKLLLDSPFFAGELFGFSKTGEDGKHWFCATE